MLLALSTGHKIGLGAVAGVFILFALASAVWIPRFRPDFPGRRLRPFIAVVVALTVATLLAVVFLAGEEEEEPEAARTEVTEPAEPPPGPPPAPPTAPPEQPTGDAVAGKSVFASAGCGSCHVLEAAGSSGTVGPSLDTKKPDLALIVDRVTNGKQPMPSFKDSLSEKQIQDVAAFVFESTRGS